MSLTFAYKGFIVTLKEPLTPEEEVVLKEYLDHVRANTAHRLPTTCAEPNEYTTGDASDSPADAPK